MTVAALNLGRLLILRFPLEPIDDSLCSLHSVQWIEIHRMIHANIANKSSIRGKKRTAHR